MAQEVTLTAAMRANLISLQNTEVLLNRTQERLATGKKVNSALDNPLNFFAAAAHMQRASDLSERKDGMGEAIQTIKAANNGIEGIKALLANAKGLVEAARTSTDTSVQEKQFEEVMAQISQLVQDSGYKGTNFLNGTGVSLDVLFNETGTNKLTLTGFDGNATALVATTFTATYTAVAITDVIGTNVTFGASGSNLNYVAAAITSAMSKLQSEASKLSSNLAIINARLDFTNQMVNTLKEGADKLTLADTNEEGANMLALQTRQQLGVTSLSLASQAAQSVLRLF
ncbi:flagellin [Sulfuricystis thermophila]|uniref:flagellin N-terminal helical domain-containing protein n=1 Tax=Sulfuricystis thermophila TaxID=2496847 RepID=UPI0010369414|nr:flagellin [Sulfuricystis thermophila]